MQSNLEIIKEIITKETMNITLEKEKLTQMMRKISLKFFNEFCDVYLDKISEEKSILEVHFNDDNYYEIDIVNTDTIDAFAENILKDFINERFIDKKTIGENRNNIRYFRKYNH